MTTTTVDASAMDDCSRARWTTMTTADAATMEDGGRRRDG